MRFICSALVVFAVCLLTSGCGTPKAELIPVTGTVKIDGQPAADIIVQFVPKTTDEAINAPTSQAMTDESGNFELFTTKNVRGAIAGPHLVSLSDTTAERVEQGEAGTKPPRLDPKYSTESIEVTVVAGEPVSIEATGPQ